MFANFSSLKEFHVKSIAMANNEKSCTLNTTDSVCATCWDHVENEANRFPCGHIMHTSCILECLSKEECPMCRRNLRGYFPKEMSQRISCNQKKYAEDMTERGYQDLIELERVRSQRSIAESRAYGVGAMMLAERLARMMLTPQSISPEDRLPVFEM